MTISKKLLIIGALALGMQQIALPFTSAVHGEASQMLIFAQTLRQVNHKEALNIAQWLEQQSCDTYNVSDCDIIAIAHVINNPDLTIQSKISVLSQAMANQKSQQATEKYQQVKNGIGRTISNICGAIVTVALFGGFLTLATIIAIEEAKHPRPYNPYTPGITFTIQTNKHYPTIWRDYWGNWHYSCN